MKKLLMGLVIACLALSMLTLLGCPKPPEESTPSPSPSVGSPTPPPPPPVDEGIEPDEGGEATDESATEGEEDAAATEGEEGTTE